VFVQLTGLADEDTFTVWSSVLKLPANDEVINAASGNELVWHI